MHHGWSNLFCTRRNTHAVLLVNIQVRWIFLFEDVMLSLVKFELGALRDPLAEGLGSAGGAAANVLVKKYHMEVCQN
jgi:hypothetical protein